MYYFLYNNVESADIPEFNKGTINYLHLSNGSIILNYNHMIPIEEYNSNHSSTKVEIRTNRIKCNYGNYMTMPLNECYYSLEFEYSDAKNMLCLSDSSFVQLCTKNGNSCMECVRYTLKSL